MQINGFSVPDGNGGRVTGSKLVNDLENTEGLFRDVNADSVQFFKDSGRSVYQNMNTFG